MSRLIKAVMTVAMMASPGSIEAQTLPLDTQSYLLARAESLDLSERLVAFVAERAEPTQLGAQAFALETESSPRAVITRLCGNVSEAYIAAFRARNSATDLDLDAPLTAEQGSNLRAPWPRSMRNSCRWTV